MEVVLVADVAGFTQDAIARYAPDIDIPPPAVLDQARRNIALQVDLLREFGAISAADLAELAGSRAKRPTTTVDNWRRAHKVVTVRWREQTLVPGFLLGADGQPNLVAQPALTCLADQGFTDWQATLWWTVPAPALDGERPVDLLVAAPKNIVGSENGEPSVAERLAAAAVRRRDWF
jgi:hypothetical protein